MLLCATVPDTEVTFVDDLERDLTEAGIDADWIITQNRGLLYLFLRSGLRAVGVIRRYQFASIIPFNEGLRQGVNNRCTFIDMPEFDGDENLPDLVLAKRLIEKWTEDTWAARPDDDQRSKTLYTESFVQKVEKSATLRRRKPMSQSALRDLLGGDEAVTDEEGNIVEMTTLSA